MPPPLYILYLLIHDRAKMVCKIETAKFFLDAEGAGLFSGRQAQLLITLQERFTQSIILC
jgi:hypothetical protein